MTGTTKPSLAARVPATAAGPDGPAAPAGGGGVAAKSAGAARALGGRVYLVVAAALFALAGAVLAGDAAWPGSWTWDAETPLDELNRWLILNRDSHPLFLYFLLHLSNNVNSAVDTALAVLQGLGWPGVTVAATLGAWAAAGGGTRPRALTTAGTALAAFAAIGLLGMWPHAMLTLALMVVAVTLSAVLGLLLGLAAGLSDRAGRALRPVFDTMQVLPAFAYLLPFVLLFGIGTAPALFATVIYAAPPMARLTALGLREADPAALECARSLGAGPWQRLLTARLPLARPRMLLGLNQTIMMALSMVVIASIIGAGGLGDQVFDGLRTQDIGKALTAGIAIVLIAIWLDRTTAAAGERLEHPGAGTGRAAAALPLAVTVAATVAAWLLGRVALGLGAWPDGWTFSIADPVNDTVDWMVVNLGSGVPLVGGTLTWAENFTLWVLNPLRDGLTAIPWWALLPLAGVLGFLAGRLRSALTAMGALAAIGVLGLWDKSLNTLSQVLGALLLTLLIGFAAGIAAARRPLLEKLLRPVLDVLQTMPQFIYLIPVVALFGVGRIAAITAAVVYALPAVVRITTQGVRQVDATVLEASRSLGATPWQQLRQVQLPLARAQLLLAVNQGVVLVLAVVVVGGLVGGGALGFDTVYGLQRGDLGVGLPAGAAIVCLGLLLDRITQPGRDAAPGPGTGRGDRAGRSRP
ncbi:ABC transporter permease [Streptomyces aidingensis]|uniref:Glycine betaine/proline transport system permease protein n=1 Tax=Streptomyces aidingensis TaxID=910347 RepID=A0A1I1EFX5_9ACTN|nr:ABC transporter permease subunit [Streptomyces aidingensis]SFB85646.1 glycine betaine/proline transport system permease protein [Streptomyces aidingensis]